MKKKTKGELEKERLQLLKKGDREAFSAIFDHYHSGLFRFCFRFLKSKDLSDEVVQETFLKIWQVRDRIDTDNKDFSSFIFRIARNLTIDQLRKEARADLFKMALQQQMTAHSQTTEESVYFSELSTKMSESINELPQQRQQIFRLSREQGLSHEEIAMKLGISKNTVKVSIFKALKDLRSTLSDFDTSHYVVLIPLLLN